MSDLGELGLSSYEEEAYRTLLELGPATASEVSEASGVPRGRIYDVLNGLAARDLVRSREGDPRRYAPVEPELAVERLLDERKRDLAAERERYEDLAASVGSELAGTTPAEGRFWSAGAGTEEMGGVLREQFGSADERIRSVVGPPYDDLDWRAYEAELDALADLAAGDLELRWLLSDAAVAGIPGWVWDALPEDGPRIRRHPGIDVSLDVVDDREVYVSVPAPFSAALLGAAVVPDRAFARRVATAFDEAWERADPVEL